MKKYAYLIMPFNNFEILKKQITLLDYPGNDIFIHMDGKIGDFDEEQFLSIPRFSKLYFIPRKNLYWADYSQVDIVLDLIHYANETDKYAYFHLLSGVDLPIKTQKYIRDKLENCNDLLLGIVPRELKYCDDRVKYYYNFTNKPYYRNCKPLKAFNVACVYLQKLFFVNRLRNENLRIYNGWDWCSLPYDFCMYLLENREYIYKIFRKTLCPSELVYHTMAYNSPVFKDRIKNIGDLSDSSMRLIDWNRGRPYTFRRNEYEEIMNSKCFFARKFDENVDFEIVKMIFDNVYEKQLEEMKLI